MNALARLEALGAPGPLLRVGGVVTEIAPAHLRVAGLSAHLALGDRVRIGGGDRLGEAIRIGADAVLVTPYEPHGAIALGTRVFCEGAPTLRPHSSWRGRVLDALGRPLDGLGPLAPGATALPLDRPPPPALGRARVGAPLMTGVRVVDAFTPLCRGQRIGVFAGSGVGKSTLLAMLAQADGFDAIVVALVGERGREVREFLEGPLHARRAETVAVVATADESAAMRRLAAKTATAIAESFRDAGASVLLIVDSVTRFAQASRELGLAGGEPAVARGFPPSVFAELPRLLERAGPGGEGTGSITAIFSVLVDGDDHNDPVADAIRGTLDGHLVLDRAIAIQGRYPAIDPLRSLSRLAQSAWTPEQARLVAVWRGLVARYEDTRDLRAMGGYQPGSDPHLDGAVALAPKLYAALSQGPACAPSLDAFREIAAALG